MKKYITLIILALLLSFFLGTYLYKLDQINEKVAFDVEYTTLSEKKSINEIVQETSSEEDKININTKVFEKVYYNDCNHIIEKEIEVDEHNINKTKDMIQAEYIGWEIQKFTNNEVVVYKEVYDFCDEHYCLKDVNGEIMAYKLDKYGKEKELVADTDIKTKYLSEEDLEELKNGIVVYSKVDLNKKIEDYE